MMSFYAIDKQGNSHLLLDLANSNAIHIIRELGYQVSDGMMEDVDSLEFITKAMTLRHSIDRNIVLGDEEREYMDRKLGNLISNLNAVPSHNIVYAA